MFYKTRVLQPLIFISFFLAFQTTYASGTWDGTGDGVHWDDPLNWSDDVEPTAADIVTIPAGDSVVIRMPGELAEGVIVQSGAILIIQTGGDLTCNNAINGLELNDNSRVIIEAGASFSATNSSTDGIIIRNARLVNRGKITLTDMDDEGICLLSSGARLINYDSIIIDGTGNSNEGLELAGNSTFINRSGAYFSIENSDLEVIDGDGTLINHGKMDLEANSDNTDAFEIDSLINTGVINITGSLGSGQTLDLDQFMVNEGRINITATVSGGTALINSANSTNRICGIINITGNFAISNSSSFVNDGIIATAFTGSNTNSGTFVNNGEIRTTTGTFTVAPNALIGSGSVLVGPIPATTPLGLSCDTVAVIPTMSEWGLFLFGLIVFTCALVAVYNVKRLKVSYKNTT